MCVFGCRFMWETRRHLTPSFCLASLFLSLSSYKEANPECPLGADSVHVLLYALLILNTSLHNPILKRSRQATMSRTVFCQMVRRH